MSKEGIYPSTEKIEAIENFRLPRDIKELRSFLGCVTFLGSFIPNLATILEPLRKLTRNGEYFEWGNSQSEAFEKTKKILKEEIVKQAFFQKGLETKLFTDASAVGLGAVLTQTQLDQQERPILYASKSLTKTERSYPQLHREALAVVWAVEKFSYYLLGREFTIVTDNNALKQIYSNEYKDSKRIAMRFEGWHLRLTPFKFRIQHIAERKGQWSRRCFIKIVCSKRS